MEYVLTKAKLKGAMFDGRGYLVYLKDNKERRGVLGALMNGAELYMSRDAVEVIRRWVRMCELRMAGDEEFKYVSDTITLGDITFVLYDRADYDYTDITQIHPTQLAALFNDIRENFTIGFDEAVWHKRDNHLAPYMTESYNKPGRMIQFNFDYNGASYDYRLINQPAPVPYVTRDLSMVRMADALLNIANTQSYPQGGYKLNLQLGFGNLDLAEMTRDGLRELAERLIP